MVMRLKDVLIASTFEEVFESIVTKLEAEQI